MGNRIIDTATETLPPDILEAAVLVASKGIMDALRVAVTAPEPILRNLVATFRLAATERGADPKLSDDPLTAFIAVTADVLARSLADGGNPTTVEVVEEDPQPKSATERSYGQYL